MLINLIWFVLIGVLAGWLAGKISKGRGFGFWGDLLVGVIGAFVGGFLFDLLGLAAYGLIARLVMSVIGAIVFLWIVSFFRNRV